MDTILKIIKDNEAFFSGEEPEQGHFDRFRNRLGHEKTNQLIPRMLLWQAAAVILFVAGSLLFLERTFNQPNTTSLGEVSAEYHEFENYYSSLIQSRLNELEKMQFHDFMQKKSVLSEIAIMDANYIQLKEELAKNPNNERIINAMIRYYEIKANAIEQVIDVFSANHYNQIKGRNDHEKF
ncbi:MAG: hypothetical protein ACOCYF_00755 [Bacteroidota bacterium]